MTDQEDVNKLEPSKQQAFDTKAFEGKRVKLLKPKIVDSFTSYNEEGHWEEGLKIPVKKLQVRTEDFIEIETPEGKKPIFVSKLFSLKKEKQKDGTVKITWSTHEKGGLHKFLRKMRKNSPAELENEYVTLTTTPGKGEKSDRDFLTFATE